MEIIQLPYKDNPIFQLNTLKDNQFYKASYAKKHIFLHHTAGSSVEGAISWWNKEPDHVATPFLIDRDGKIYQAFDPAYWSYALGLKGGTEVEKASIHIELISWGPLQKTPSGYFKTVAGNVTVPNDEVISFAKGYRGYTHFQYYTPDQIESLKWLISHLCQEFGITLQKNRKNFWVYEKSYTLKGKLPMGVWSHTTVRADKSDIVPQPNLVEMIYSL